MEGTHNFIANEILVHNTYISGNVGIGTTNPQSALDINTTMTAGYIRASNFNTIPASQWPGFNGTNGILTDALWVGWDDTNKVWKYYKQTGGNGLTDPGNPNTWAVNGTSIGYFDGDLSELPTGTHINNRYNPKAMAFRCGQDDIQIKVGCVWVDKYASRIIDVGSNYSGNTLIDDSATTQDGAQSASPFYMAFSQRAQGSTGMTWFHAEAAAANAGKRLCTNAEWQMAASGTSRSSGNNQTNGDTWSSVVTDDLSRYGAVGMVGNVWEWVADWYVAGTTYTWTGEDGTAYNSWGTGYGGDNTWNVGGRAYGGNGWQNGLPAAALRGGYWDSGEDGGVFTFNLYHASSHWNTNFGFRSCR